MRFFREKMGLFDSFFFILFFFVTGNNSSNKRIVRIHSVSLPSGGEERSELGERELPVAVVLLHSRSRDEGRKEVLVVAARFPRIQNRPQPGLELVEGELAVAVHVEDAEDSGLSSSSSAAGAEALERSAKLDDTEALLLRLLLAVRLLLAGLPAQELEYHRNVGVLLELRERGEVGEREEAGVAGEAVETVEVEGEERKRSMSKN